MSWIWDNKVTALVSRVKWHILFRHRWVILSHFLIQAAALLRKSRSMTVSSPRLWSLPLHLDDCGGSMPSSSKCPESVHLLFTPLFNPHSDKWANWVIAVITICHKKSCRKGHTREMCLLSPQDALSGTSAHDLMCLVSSGARFTYLYIEAKRALNYVLTECHWWLMGLYMYFSNHFYAADRLTAPSIRCFTVWKHGVDSRGLTIWPEDQITAFRVRIITRKTKFIEFEPDWVNFQHVLWDVWVRLDWTGLRFYLQSSQRLPCRLCRTDLIVEHLPGKKAFHHPARYVFVPCSHNKFYLNWESSTLGQNQSIFSLGFYSWMIWKADQINHPQCSLYTKHWYRGYWRETPSTFITVKPAGKKNKLAVLGTA